MCVCVQQVEFFSVGRNQMKKYAESNHLRFPVVLAGDNEGGLEVVMDSSELGACAGDPQRFVSKLREKGVLPLSG